MLDTKEELDHIINSYTESGKTKQSKQTNIKTTTQQHHRFLVFETGIKKIIHCLCVNFLLAAAD